MKNDSLKMQITKTRAIAEFHSFYSKSNLKIGQLYKPMNTLLS